MPVVVRGQILRATRPCEGPSGIGITVDTRVVGKDVTPRSFWDFAMSCWRRGGAARLGLLGNRDVDGGGAKAVARLVTYTSGGRQAAAVGACFIRELKRPNAEAEAARKKLRQILDTIKDHKTPPLPRLPKR